MSANRGDKDRTSVPTNQQSTDGPNNSNLPQQVDTIVVSAIKDILPANQQRQVVERLRPILAQMIMVSKHHSGPLPSPETVEGYEKIVPGSFQRIISMAEKDQDAFIASSKYKAQSDSFYRLACLGAGVIALGAILTAIIYLAMNNHVDAAYAVAGMGAVGVIGAFVNARWQNGAE